MGTDAVGEVDADLSISLLAESHLQCICLANTRPSRRRLVQLITIGNSDISMVTKMGLSRMEK